MMYRGIITALGRTLGKIPHLESVSLLWILVVIAVASISPIATAAEPVVDTFLATPPTVRPGETTTLSIEAHDPDCADSCTSGCGQYIRADLTQWSAALGTFENINNGNSASPYTASAVWKAPDEEGQVTVTITISDSATWMCGGCQTISVDTIIHVSESAGQEPIITSLTIAPNPVLIGDTAVLTATAEDPQGDPVTFSWSAVFGTVTPGVPGTASYMAPTIPGRDTVTCTVSDPGDAASSQNLDVTVSTAVPDSVLNRGLTTPHDVGVNRWGDLVVADAAAGGLTFVNPATGEPLRSVNISGITSVASDWLDRIVVGTRTGLLLLSPEGEILGTLDPGMNLGPVADVVVDRSGHRIWVLYGSAGRVAAFDEAGSVVHAFGQRGENLGDFSEPVALAWSPADEVLVADEGLAQVLAFDTTGDLIRTIGGFGSGSGEFTRVAGLAVGPGNTLFASDAFQSRLQVFDSNGNFNDSLGTYGDQLGSFKTPVGITLLDAPPRLAVASAHSSSIQIFRLDGAAVEIPEATVDPTALDFGEVVVGQMSNPTVVRLINTGSIPVGFYGLESPDAFDVETTCEGGLAPGESCTATVIFNPFRTGRAMGILRFLCGGQDDQVVTLEGRAIPAQAPLAALSPESVLFEPVLIGHGNEVRTITLSNVGGGALDITSVLLGGPAAAQFLIADDQCTGTSLSGDDACVLAVLFSPNVIGLHDAILTVESSSSGGPVTAALEGEGLQDIAIPTIGGWGVTLMVVGLALLGMVLLRRRTLPLCIVFVFLLGSSTAWAVDPPHWYFGMDCESCHTGHNAAGGGLTNADGNSNLCLSCHTEGGRAGTLPILPAHTLATHHYNVTPDAPRWGSQMPTNPEMANRIMDGVFVCSTCHDQHSTEAANRGRCRLSIPEILTAFGSTGEITVGGGYTGAGGSSYLIEITVADTHFRFSKDGGSTWIGEDDIGADIPLDFGLTATFSGGNFALGERWRFSASFPFLRLPLDQGDNQTGDRFCRECHSLWAMGYQDVEDHDTGWMSHPVGEGLNANGKGYDRSAPLDANGAVQGMGGGDGNHSNDFNFDAEGLVQCMTCHGIHYADSNTLTEDGP
ncbi:MAG: choice-of-anchor D domain-containing protein [Thermoanaerobaculales bacterium]|nr:choice-of-anchor D domain-containing protein [Thermoanaerobaculales bacterium]